MKQREKLVRKIIPVEIYDMAGLEHWLSDMAAQGLHLVKLTSETALFRRGEPAPGARFGLEIAGFYGIPVVHIIGADRNHLRHLDSKGILVFQRSCSCNSRR